MKFGSGPAATSDCVIFRTSSFIPHPSSLLNRYHTHMSEHAEITEDAVRHVARLSRLALNDDEVKRFARQLGDVMQHIQKLEAIDVAGVEPMVHAHEQVNVLRDDVEQPGLAVDLVLRNAPQRDEPFFKVPKVIGEGSS